MPIGPGGGYVPWNVPVVNATSGYTPIVQAITINIPWLFPLVLGVVYLVLLIVTRDVKGRKKYAYITFLGMLTSMVFELFSLVSPAITAGTAGIWIVTTLIVIAGGD